MKIAISISGESLNSPFDSRFGRAETFCLVDSESGAWSVYPNPAFSASGGAGVQAAQFIVDLGVQAVISGAYGPNAFEVLQPAQVAAYLAPAGESLTAAELLERLRAGTLAQAQAATHAGHHGGAA